MNAFAAIGITNNHRWVDIKKNVIANCRVGLALDAVAISSKMGLYEARSRNFPLALTNPEVSWSQ